MSQIILASLLYKNKKTFFSAVEKTGDHQTTALSTQFFLKQAGFYFYLDKTWNFEQEGLYEFYDYNGEISRFYYFKDDVCELVSTIMPFCFFFW